jgi:uncharacterized protein YcaQ
MRSALKTRVDLSLGEARRIALEAQSLHESRPSAVSTARSNLLRTIDRLGVLQIDAVNVLARAHYMPLFSRHGVYATDRLDAAAYGTSQALFEYWGHMASLLPMRLYPLFRWRMDRAAKCEGIYSGWARFAREKRPYIDRVLEEVRLRGALRAGDLQTQAKRAKGGWWGWSDAKTALEFLFWAGLVTTKTRKNFERVYDLSERVIPREVLALPAPSAEDAQRELLRISSRALGIATEDDLADYFRIRIGEARPRIAELVEERALARVRIEGIEKPAYLDNAATLPRSATGAALLSPFDPLIWYRARTERLFGFRYRIEIYTPEHKREHGYYVLPFLDGEHLAARVDLKAAREESALLVHAAHLEPGLDGTKTAASLASELRLTADWLGLERIVVARKGKLAGALAKAVKVTERSPYRR